MRKLALLLAALGTLGLAAPAAAQDWFEETEYDELGTASGYGYRENQEGTEWFDTGYDYTADYGEENYGARSENGYGYGRDNYGYYDSGYDWETEEDWFEGWWD